MLYYKWLLTESNFAIRGILWKNSRRKEGLSNVANVKVGDTFTVIVSTHLNVANVLKSMRPGHVLSLMDSSVHTVEKVIWQDRLTVMFTKKRLPNSHMNHHD